MGQTIDSKMLTYDECSFCLKSAEGMLLHATLLLGPEGQKHR